MPVTLNVMHLDERTPVRHLSCGSEEGGWQPWPSYIRLDPDGTIWVEQMERRSWWLDEDDVLSVEVAAMTAAGINSVLGDERVRSAAAHVLETDGAAGVDEDTGWATAESVYRAEIQRAVDETVGEQISYMTPTEYVGLFTVDEVDKAWPLPSTGEETERAVAAMIQDAWEDPYGQGLDVTGRVHLYHGDLVEWFAERRRAAEEAEEEARCASGGD